MAGLDYWKRQGKTAIFPEVDTERPEQRKMAGKLLIVGGNKGAFFAVAQAMTAAQKLGVGEVRVLMPASLRGKVPSAPEIYFAEAEASGAFGKAALSELMAQAAWADAVVLIGDMGKNAETSVMLARFLKDRIDTPVYLTRDAVDAAVPDVMNWAVMREAETGLLLAMPQLQKLLRTLYYPKVVTLSMPTNQLIETLHKFTISYPELNIITFHNGQIVVAQNGEVVTTALADTDWTLLTLFGGELLVRAAVYKLWNPTEKSFATSASAVAR